MTDSPTDDVYLFLFPAADVDGSNDHRAVHLSPENERYYWSFDPEGLDRLPQDALDKLSLPSVSFRAIISGVRWIQEQYDSISKFHHTKGCDPTSQDVATELGYPLVDVDRLNNLINGGKVRVSIFAIQPQRKLNTGLQIEVVDEVEGQEGEF
jgi:hypothetical protein